MAAAYRDRADAGRALAWAVLAQPSPADPLVLGLPRGGVPVAAEVARALNAPLDVLVVRKLGVPGHEELAMGAIASGGSQVLDRHLIARARIAPEAVARVVARERAELVRRERSYRDDRPPPELAGRTLLLVDDGLATGSTMLAAVRAVRKRLPARIVVAIPVAPPETVTRLASEVDAVVCPLTPDPFIAVSAWFEDFRETSDGEVRRLLRASG